MAPWKCIDDSGHGGRDVGRMHGGEHQVSRLSGGDCDTHRLEIAHLPDGDHIGCVCAARSAVGKSGDANLVVASGSR